jgi:hypothetical protein
VVCESPTEDVGIIRFRSGLRLRESE